MVGFGCYEHPVDKSGRCPGLLNARNNYQLIDVGSDDMREFRKLYRFADDIVVALANGMYQTLLFLLRQIEFHKIANGNRIGGAYAMNPELPFQAALKYLTSFCPDKIKTTGRFSYNTFQIFAIT